MAASFDITITVNHEDGSEREINAAASCDLSKIGEVVTFALGANNVTEWSSLMVIIGVPNRAPETPKRPTLRIVA